MFKKITLTFTIILISAILLTPVDSFAQGRGGRGGRGGGMMGGGMDPSMMRGRGFNPVQDVNISNFRKYTLLTYLTDANDNSVDPNSLSDDELRNLYTQIARANEDVIDISRFDEFVQLRDTILGQGSIDPNDDSEISVQLNGLTINAIIEMLIRWTGKAVLPSNEALDLRLTVFSPQRMKKSEALNLLYSAMRQQGFVAETRNNIIYIKPVSDASIYHADFVDDLKTIVNKQEIVCKIFKIKNYAASTMGQLILPFLNPTGNATADETTRTLMVTDTVETLIHVENIINQFDKELADTVTELLKVQHSNPTELADMIAAIMTKDITSSGTFGSFMGGMMGGMPTPTTRTTSRTSSSRTSSDRNDRSSRNTTTSSRDRDRRSSSSNQLSRMMGMGTFGAASASASSIGTGKPEPQLIPDELNKIIIATATPEDMVTIKTLLNQLDTETKVIWNPTDLTTLGKNQVVQKIYHLQFNTPAQLAQILDPLLTQDGYLSAEESTGTLMIRDTVATLIELEDIIKEFDKEESNPEEQRIFIIEKGDPREIVEIINTILSGSTTATGTRTTSGFNTRTTGRTGTTGRTNTRTTGRTGTTTRMGF